jgi:putative phage-type endonuclease
MEQQSDAWFSARLGNATASKINDIVAKTKDGKASASRKNYAVRLALERLTGNKTVTFQNSEMLWGVEKEPLARAAYEASRGVLVMEEGYVPHPTIERSGASPDGLVGDDGLVEIKCPNEATHLENLMRGSADPQYLNQMYWQMACTDRKWCDFVSYDPRFPEHLQMVVYRVNHDAEKIGQLENEVVKFLGEVDAIVEKLNGLA